MKMTGTFAKSEIVKERKEQTPDPVSEGDILSWDKQPKKLKEYQGDKGRTYARVSRVEVAHDIRYAKLAFKEGDYQDFDCRTLDARIREGAIQIEDPWKLLQLIADSLWSENADAAASISAIIQENASP